jgi:hypothetical protein
MLTNDAQPKFAAIDICKPDMSAYHYMQLNTKIHIIHPTKKSDMTEQKDLSTIAGLALMANASNFNLNAAKAKKQRLYLDKQANQNKIKAKARAKGKAVKSARKRNR